jgi:hypothetical protein
MPFDRLEKITPTHRNLFIGIVVLVGVQAYTPRCGGEISVGKEQDQYIT